MPRKNKEERIAYNKFWRKKNKEHTQNYYEENREKFKKRNKQIKIRNRNYISNIKKNGKCFRCGWDEDPVGLDFHHLNPKEKEKNISWFSKCSYGLETIKEEISKCVLVCANCHRILHKKHDNTSIL